MSPLSASPIPLGAHEDVVADAAVDGRDDADGAVSVEATDECGVGALDDLGDGTGAALPPTMRLGPDRDDVAVHGAADVARGNEEVALRRLDEAVAMTGHRDAADDLTVRTGLRPAPLAAHSAPF